MSAQEVVDRLVDVHARESEEADSAGKRLVQLKGRRKAGLPVDEDEYEHLVTRVPELESARRETWVCLEAAKRDLHQEQELARIATQKREGERRARVKAGAQKMLKNVHSIHRHTLARLMALEHLSRGTIPNSGKDPELEGMALEEMAELEQMLGEGDAAQ